MDTSSFNFFTPTKLIFGSGSLKNLKQIAPLYGKKCLLVSRPKDGSLGDRIGLLGVAFFKTTWFSS